MQIDEVKFRLRRIQTSLFDAFEDVRTGCRRDTEAQDTVWVGE